MYLAKNKIGNYFYLVKQIAEYFGDTSANIWRILRSFPDWEKIKRKK